MILKANKQVLAVLFFVNNMSDGRYNIIMPKSYNTEETLIAKLYYEKCSKRESAPAINMYIFSNTFGEDEIIFNIINDIFKVEAVPEVIYYFDFANHEYGNDIEVFSINKKDLDQKTEETLITTGNYFSSYDGYSKKDLKRDFNKHVINNLTNVLNTFVRKGEKHV